MEQKKGKKQKKASYDLVFRIVILFSLLVFFAFLILFLLDYTPITKEPVTNMTYKEYSTFLYKYEIMMYPSNAEVVSVEPDQERVGIGVVTDPWNLNFGSMPAGGGSSRFMDLQNIGGEEAKVIFKARGNISYFVNFDKNYFMLGPEENMTVKITFSSTEGNVGNFSGRIDRIVKIPKHDFIYEFW